MLEMNFFLLYIWTLTVTTCSTDSDKENISSTNGGSEYKPTGQTSFPSQTTVEKDNTQSTVNMFKHFSTDLIIIKTVYLSTLIAVGLLSNTMSLVIILKQGMTKVGVWIYVASLSLADNFVLIMMFIFQFSREPVNYLGQMDTKSDFLCKFLTSCTYISVVLSNNILSVMSCERFLIIWNPYKPRPSRNMALFKIMTVVIISMVAYVPFVVVTHGLQVPHIDSVTTNGTIKIYPEATKFCTLMPDYFKYSKYFRWMNLSIYYIWPTTLIIASNIGIIVVLIKRARNQSIHRDSSQIRSDIRIAYMLLSVSLFYVVSVTPNAIYTGAYVWEYFYNTPMEAFAFNNTAWSVIEALSLLNNCANYFLYVLSGRSFRQEAVNFLRCRKMGTNRSGVSSSIYQLSNNSNTSVFASANGGYENDKSSR